MYKCKLIIKYNNDNMEYEEECLLDCKSKEIYIDKIKIDDKIEYAFIKNNGELHPVFSHQSKILVSDWKMYWGKELD